MVGSIALDQALQYKVSYHYIIMVQDQLGSSDLEGAQRSNHSRWLRRLQRELRRLLIITPLERTLRPEHDLHLALGLLYAPCLLLLEKDLLDLRHLDPNPYAHCDGYQKHGAKHDGLDYVIVTLLYKKNTQVHEEDLLGQRQQSGDDEIPELDVAGREHGGGEMRWDCGQADDEYDEEAAITRQTCHGAVIEVRALQCKRFAAKETLERKPSPNCVIVSAEVHRHVDTAVALSSAIWEVVLSPINVPAATMANPIHNPYTTPHRSAMISWPKSGGNDMTTRITMGISHPAGSSRTFSEKGRSF